MMKGWICVLCGCGGEKQHTRRKCGAALWLRRNVESTEKFSMELESSSDVYGKANELYAQLLSKGIDYRAAQWTLRDALDRMTIRRALSTQHARFVYQSGRQVLSVTSTY